MYWLQFSDFYDWPYIQYFDDFADLEKKLLNTDFVTVSKLMRQENDIRRYKMLEQWCNIIMQISNQYFVFKYLLLFFAKLFLFDYSKNSYNYSQPHYGHGVGVGIRSLVMFQQIQVD